MPEHKGTREFYDHISQWVAPDFFFSKREGWGRFGFLGVFGDYVLSCTRGDILEIGVGESSVYLAKLARKFNRRIYHCDISPDKINNPLTIEDFFSTERSIFIRDSSDNMFQSELTPIALGFIDGDHNFTQVEKDFNNLWPWVVDNGYVLLHDSYPPSKEYLNENRCGTVFVLRQELEKRPDVDCITLTRGCAMDVGLTICRKKPNGLAYFNE